MTGLKFWTKKDRQPQDNGTAEAGSPRSVSRLEPVLPRRRFTLGRHLAFYIDDTSIQTAAAFHYGSKIHLQEVSKQYLPQTAGTDDERKPIILRVIRDFRRKYGGRRPTISLVIAGPETALRTVMIPQMKTSELDSAIKFEVKRQIPFPSEDCLSDYRVIRKTTEDSQGKFQAAILAATKRLVLQALAPMEELSLEVSFIHQVHDVIGPLLRHLPHFDEDACHSLINVQRHRTEISYYRGGDLEFFHISSLGSSFLAHRSDPTMFEYFAESLATEIQNSLDYYSSRYMGQVVDQTYFYGDLSYTEDIINLLSDRFSFSFSRFPVELLSFVGTGHLNNKESLAVCLPTLAAVVCQHKLANLLPANLKQNQTKRKIDRLGAVVLILLTCSLAAQWLSGASSTSSAKGRLTDLERQIAEFKATETYATYNHLKRKIAYSQSYLEMTKENPSYLGLNLKELSNMTPSAVRLINLGYQVDSLMASYQLVGTIVTQSTPPEVILAEFVENLTASPFFEDVQVKRHVKHRKEGYFELDFNLSMTGTT